MVEIEQLLRPGAPFFLIAGPCLLEDEELNLRVAETIARTAERLSIPAVFKASFDKANRSSISSPRGPGLERGLELLAQVRAETGLPVTTDIHEIAQAMPVAEVVDLLQIPAFLCRQTDLVLAAAETGKAINLKKGQWMAPGDMASQVEKARGGGAQSVAVTERGSAFGYHNLVVDMRSFALMQESCACPAIFDASHSVQLPAGAGTKSGGEPRHIHALAAAATAAGADGLFVEVHPEPARAPSDGSSMLPLAELSGLLERVLAVRQALMEREESGVDG